MKKRLEFLVAPTVTVLLTLLIYYLFRLYPFAEQTLAWCDMKQQVIPFLMDFKNILEGRSDFLLNMQNAGGMSFLGVFFFFISSPFTFLVLFVDSTRIYLFANILVLLKMAVCAMTAGIFFRHSFQKLGTVQNTILSVAYAFSGYTMLYFQNMVWLDVAAMLPVVLLGLDLLLKKDKIACYVLSFSAVLVLNFYLTYMVVLFLVLACGVWIFFVTKEPHRRKNVVLLGFSTLLVVLITSAVWLPSLMQYLSSARTIGLLESLASGKMTTHFYTTLPILLCSGTMLAGILGAFFLNSKPKRETWGVLILWVLMVIPLFVEPINKMWHTGSYQAFPARYGYITVFLGLILFAKAFSDMNETNSLARSVSPWGGAIGGIAVLAVISSAFMLMSKHYESLTVYTRTLWASKSSTIYLALFASVVVLATFLLLYLCRERFLTKRLFSILLSLVLVTECLFTGSVYMGSATNTDAPYMAVLDLADKINDPTLYRVKMREKSYDVNLTGALGYPTLSHYTSLTDETFLSTMKKLGYSSYWMEVGSHGGTEFTDALLANRYSVIYSSQVKTTDRVIYDNGVFAIILNPNTLPFGTVITSEDIGSLEALPEMSRMELQQYLFQSILGKGQLVYSYDFSNSENLVYSHDEKYHLSMEIPEGPAVINYHVLVEDTQSLYFDCFDKITNRLSEPVYNGLAIEVNGQQIAEYYPTQSSNGLLNLGTFTDEVVDIRVTVNKPLDPKSFGLYGVDLNALREAESRTKSASFVQEDNTLTGTVTIQDGEDKYLFLPLPYSAGYTARVNGEKVPVYRVCDGFMAVKLNTGGNTIALTFLPSGLTAGLLISAAGILLFVLFLLFLKRGGYQRIKFLEAPALAAFTVVLAGVFLAIYVFPVLVHLFYEP